MLFVKFYKNTCLIPVGVFFIKYVDIGNVFKNARIVL